MRIAQPCRLSLSNSSPSQRSRPSRWRPSPRRSYPQTTRPAREARVIYFIDRALATFDRDKQPLYVIGLEQIQAKAKGRSSKITRLSDLNSERQIKLLKKIQLTEFFSLIRMHTIMGYLANPEYGGNDEFFLKRGLELLDAAGALGE